MAGVALSAATWGVVRPIRAAAVAVVAVAATTVVLSFVNFEEKPAGIRLIEAPARESIWTMPPEWAQNIQPELVPVTRHVRAHAAPGDTIALTRDALVRPFIYAGWPDLVYRLVYADSPRRGDADAAPSGRCSRTTSIARTAGGSRCARRRGPSTVRFPAPAADSGTVPRMPSSLSILMPVFNELATVEAAIDDALTAELPVDARQLVIVDDGSTDGTRELLASKEWPAEVTIVEHDRNRGKGAALRTGLQHATGDWAAILDADLEYRASDLGPLLEPLLNGDARVVFGTRSWSSHAAFSFWYVVGNKGVTMATNVIYNCWISDVMTCHKAMSTELFRSLELRERGFAIEPEIAARVLRAGERIYEVPITYKARSREEGKKLTTLDGLRVLRTLLRCRVD